MRPLRLIFMGTPDFAVPTLAALRAAGHSIVCVYCQPPRRAGRGQKPRLAPVQVWAEAHGIPVRTPKSLKDAHTQAEFAALAADAAVVVAYGLILPPAILAAPRLGCLNLHGSLLPRWRGAAPIQRALLAGDDRTGVSIMQMDEGLDTGPVVLSATVGIDAVTTAADLHDKLAELGAKKMVETLSGLDEGRLATRAQPGDGATYATKLSRAEGRLDWRGDAAVLDRQVRAFTPWPGAWFEDSGERIKVLAATPIDQVSGTPGEVLDDRLTIACGRGALRLVRVQRAGRTAMDAADFLRGRNLAVGARLPVQGEV